MLLTRSNHRHKNRGAYISEIFESFQGEGIYLGIKQLFVRFSGCNLRCGYCDSKAHWKRSKYCLVHINGKILRYRNPVTVEVLKDIVGLYKKEYHSISLTGGEPLLNSIFIEEFLSKYNKNGRPIYLETNGTLPAELKRVLEYVDIVAMDIKLPSSAKIKGLWKEHKIFMGLCRKKVFVKAVVCNKTTLKEIKKTVKIIKAANKNITLVIQPVHKSKTGNLLKRILKESLGLKYIRVIPQTHKILGLK